MYVTSVEPYNTGYRIGLENYCINETVLYEILGANPRIKDTEIYIRDRYNKEGKKTEKYLILENTQTIELL